ncbi:reverse transcriptase-like protein [Heyndrickxia sporothermodurans]|uniref:Reverse transcriptase-like protein n=2 Tax=Heyndrickxia sporothermodurans TaxID=46224 RepID=A0AB37HHU5_9BACI|nr:reverse transcriptase-like protein [Heyndrickxia sporothermodurans]MBL5767053.1 reverse transcriptase-like protein [Heyndrickxia sporothermodurans]MBL5770502.1 reverse transcriptase-like protein [Heyndrickxia sporothermodurans]MBL5774191.1 reverse transcriptase-like protein [Heyndrickxia sporothermodurans]MBL5778075.1 reverse transcriptase-like protein [Heyndrickxia sporothermodurans]MBL5782966.1 reverse transcriptase-like protein [Heyndrickxia sporothermodurans]
MKYKIKWQYKGAKTESILLESEWASDDVIETLMNDFLKTGRTVDLSIVDEMGNEWTKKEFLKLKNITENEPENIMIYFDGGFDLQTRLSGIGMVIYYDKGGKSYRLRANDQLTELESNNEAEYAALYNAVVLLEGLNIKPIPCTIRGDSHGLLKQLTGEWPCLEQNLNRWLDRIEEKINKLGIKPLYEPITRKQNKEADQLASQALKNILVNSHIEL